MSESETFLGSETEGAFDLEGGVPTYFSGVSGEFALTDTWRLVGSAYAGLSYPEATANSLFADVSPILTQSFTAGIVGDGVFRDDDRFGLLVNQPLRVTSGSAELAFATGRDQSRNLLSETFTADLAPDGREVDLERSACDPAAGPSVGLSVGLSMEVEPGAVATTSPAASRNNSSSTTPPVARRASKRTGSTMASLTTSKSPAHSSFGKSENRCSTGSPAAPRSSTKRRDWSRRAAGSWAISEWGSW